MAAPTDCSVQFQPITITKNCSVPVYSIMSLTCIPGAGRLVVGPDHLSEKTKNND